MTALLAALLAVSVAWGAPKAADTKPAPAAAAKPKRATRVLPGADVELKTKDGWTLAAKHHPATETHLTIVLLHETGGRKENWYFLAKALAKQGIGYLALDFRGHGGSQSPPAGQPSSWRKFPPPTKSYNEWNNLVLDVDAAVEYLETQTVPLTSIGLGGADLGSSIALKYAAVHQQVPMLFMLSPGMSYREILTVNAIRAYGKRPILLVVGADDNRSTKETAILYEFAKRSAGPENTQLITAEREHGTRILVVNKGLVDRLVQWTLDPSQPVDVSTDTAGGAVPPDAGGGVPDPLPSEEQLQAVPAAPGE